jgi:uncharacterized protein (DUF488 family)
MPVWTIGHSNRSLAEFLGLLAAHGIQTVVDLRTIPRSRHNPQFNRETLPAALAGAGVEYVPLAALGGLRHPHPDSRNTGWRNLSFRGFADYMQTEAFAEALQNLIRIQDAARTAVMCAEAVPWRCHRSLIADALTAKGISVNHIMSATKASPHRLTPFARIDGGKVLYPPPEPDLHQL